MTAAASAERMVARSMPATATFRHLDVRILEDAHVLYRACRGLDDPAQLDSFRSHYELGRRPRGPEAWATVIHIGVSMFETAGPCWNLIERTRGRIGDHVARLVLTPGHGICIAKTGGPLHWSVWGRPEVLQAAIHRYVSQ
jgi:hypothetical protein